jgi:hypothetical protein
MLIVRNERLGVLVSPQYMARLLPAKEGFEGLIRSAIWGEVGNDWVELF